MNDAQFLHDVFSTQADDHADPTGVLASVHDRVSRSRRPAAAPTVAVLGATGAVLAVALTVSGLSQGSGDHDTVPATAGSSTPSPAPLHAAATAAPVPRRGDTHPRPATPGRLQLPPAPPTVAPPSSTYDYSSIAAGWLPGSAHQVEASNGPDFEQRDYTAQVDGTTMDVIIYVERRHGLPSRTEAGRHYRDLVVNGHPAREFTDDDATIVAVDLGNGTIAYAGPSVVAPTKQVTRARIARIAVHVVRKIEYGRHDPIPSR